MTTPAMKRTHRAPTGLPDERFTSFDWTGFPEPRSKDETWRFTPLTEVRPLLEPFTSDGRIVHDLLAPDSVDWSVIPISHPSVGRVLEPTDRASAVAWQNVSHAAVIGIEAGSVVRAPAIITLRGEPGRSQSHVVVHAGAGCEATVVLDRLGTTTLSANVEVIVEDGAHLTLIVVHNWDPGSIHLATHSCTLGERSSLKHVVVNLGGRLLRTVPSVRLNGSGAGVEMLGVGVAGDDQHMETRLHVDHVAPGCSSDVLYKNALVSPTARTVWIGDVRIRPQATQTSTYEVNRNLLLRPGARADSVPNLEIETGDVTEAGHASATGRFDDEQLFYLESRGIARIKAQQLVVRGFLADVVGRIDLPGIRDRIMAAVDSRLAENSPSAESTRNFS